MVALATMGLSDVNDSIVVGTNPAVPGMVQVTVNGMSEPSLASIQASKVQGITIIGSDSENLIDVSGDGSDTVDGGAGADSINGMAGQNSLVGGADNDTVFGGSEDDTIEGRDGDDLLNGQAGNDTANATLAMTSPFGEAAETRCSAGTATTF